MGGKTIWARIVRLHCGDIFKTKKGESVSRATIYRRNLSDRGKSQCKDLEDGPGVCEDYCPCDSKAESSWRWYQRSQGALNSRAFLWDKQHWCILSRSVTHCLFSENHYSCSFVNRLKEGLIEARAASGLHLHSERRWHGLEQGEKSRDDGNVFRSAGALKVESTGWVKDYKMFSKRGQSVNMLGFSGHTVSVGTIQLCCWNWMWP